MTKYARIVEEIAAEIFTPAEGFTIEESMRADVAALFTEVPDEVVLHSRRVNGAWVGPEPIEEAERAAPLPESLTPMAFYLAFKPAERIAIKGSQDAVVKEFWDTYQLAAQTQSPIHPSLVSVSGAIQYLRTIGILASDERVGEVLRGVPQ